MMDKGMDIISPIALIIRIGQPSGSGDLLQLRFIILTLGVISIELSIRGTLDESVVGMLVHGIFISKNSIKIILKAAAISSSEVTEEPSGPSNSETLG